MTSNLRVTAIQLIIARVEEWQNEKGRLTDRTWDLMGDAARELQWILEAMQPVETTGCQNVQRINDNGAREIDRLREALLKYGHHLHPNCHDLTLNADGSFGERNGCLCGFEAIEDEDSPEEPTDNEPGCPCHGRDTPGCKEQCEGQSALRRAEKASGLQEIDHHLNETKPDIERKLDDPL